MKRAGPWNEDAYTISSDDLSDSSEENDHHQQKLQNKDAGSAISNGNHPSKDVLLRRAEMYQEYMRSIPIPIQKNSVIPCTSWSGLARAVKQLYGQPLHYLTNTLLKQWDQMRVGSEEEHLPLDFVIHPSKAEALIWVTEEVHRITSSYRHLAELWTLDPMHHICIDPFVPQI